VHVRELWESPGIAARAARAGLFPASLLYSVGWESYLATYRLGIKKPVEPHSRVICIGNLQAGGIGKTPLTLAIARFFMERGIPVVVSSSGYGSPKSQDASFAPRGELIASQWGDEAAMMRWLEPELKLVVGRNRVSAASLIHREEPDSVMLMDDGFQHLPLRKHLSIVLDPVNPPNRLCLPAGPYREPRINRARADVLVPGGLRFTSKPTQLVTPEGAPAPATRYSVLCALGNPDRFLEDLRNHCPSQDGFATLKLLPDHDRLSDGKMLQAFSKEFPIVVTAKDWVKLRERGDVATYQIFVATQELRIESWEIFESFL
jgi:tetraacyldisaccharide 4'-kinase